MAFGDSDLGVFTADFGVAVVFDGRTVLGIFDRPLKTALADAGFGGINTGRPVVRLPYNAFPAMPAPGESLTVDGVAYTVADEESDTDGAFVWLPLKATS